MEKIEKYGECLADPAGASRSPTTYDLTRPNNDFVPYLNTVQGDVMLLHL